MASDKLKNELKGLGSDINQAFKQAAGSAEFKKLQKSLMAGIKTISTSLFQAADAARKSPQAKKIKSRLKRVAKEGKKEGAIQAKKAEAAAVAQLKKARQALKKLNKETESD